jgi:spore cortex biosynthesis protein YabQ
MSDPTPWTTVGSLLISGAWMAFFYRVYRIAVEELRLPRVALAIGDGMYWLVACIFVFSRLYQSNGGEVRLYVFIVLACGFWAYRWTVGRLVDRVLRYGWRIVAWTLAKLFAIIHFCYRGTVQACVYVIQWSRGFIWGIRLWCRFPRRTPKE